MTPLPGIGHGCGHNILGATSTGSGIVLREMIDQLGGTVIVFGTPGGGDGRRQGWPLVNAGGFDGVDVAMMAHPSDKYYKSGTSWVSCPCGLSSSARLPTPLPHRRKVPMPCMG